jgi:hypothetical protein
MFLSETLPTFEGKEICHQGNLVQKFLKNVITTKSHHREDSMVGRKITSSCITFGSPVANRYAQSNSITSEQAKSDNDVTSVLTACSSQKN